jgi:hypothetical protein
MNMRERSGIASGGVRLTKLGLVDANMNAITLTFVPGIELTNFVHWMISILHCENAKPFYLHYATIQKYVSPDIYYKKLNCLRL